MREESAADKKKANPGNLNGIYNDFANLLGMDAVLQIHTAFRGQQISFPVELFSKDFIKQQIAKEYNGHNVKTLATKYGYSEKWIRKILKDGADRQADAPADDPDA